MLLQQICLYYEVKSNFFRTRKFKGKKAAKRNHFFPDFKFKLYLYYNKKA